MSENIVQTHARTTDNIMPALHAPITWDPRNPREQVNVLYTLVQQKVHSNVEWYLFKKRNPARMSRLLRGIAILFTVLGGLCPILQGAIPAGYVSLSELGYVLLAIAAGVMLVDRYGGFSSAWMRYISTHLKLDALMHRFQFEWVLACAQYDLDPAASKDPAKLFALLDKLRAFATEAGALVEQETQAWMVEFQNQLALLQKATEKEKPAPQPEKRADDDTPSTGDVQVTVPNWKNAQDAVYLFVDGAPIDAVEADQEIVKARPGTREIAARTFFNGKVVKISTKAVVTAGKPVAVSLTLPFPQDPFDPPPPPPDENMVNPTPDPQ